MQKLRHHARALLSDSRGLTTVEYVLVLSLIAVFAVSSWTTFGETIEKGVSDADEAFGKALSPKER